MSNYTVLDVLKVAVKRESSDVHISPGMKPRIRIDSQLIDSEFEVVSPDAMDKFVKELITVQQWEQFVQNKELDFSFGKEGLGRFRVNAYFHRERVGLAIRILPNKIRSFQDIGMPPLLIQDIASAPNGLVLVTGSTGSGKTTTLASIINFIAKTRACHIVTIEDPIEFIFEHQKATIHQRELAQDTHSFAMALKHILRQDPDVILVGEMRDLETIEAALTVAETGHLVFGTLHTSDAVGTVNRIIDVFPEHKQRQVRTQLSFVMNAVLSQRLIPMADGKGRTLAAEVMIANSAIRSMVRENKVHQIYSSIQTGMKEGMRTINQSLAELYHDKKISVEEAISNSSSPEELTKLIGINMKKK